MNNRLLVVALGILLSASAYAVPSQPAPFEESSPALQLARRVASMENNKDLPSRAVWLGKKAAKTSQLAYKSKRKAAKKKPSVSN
jgi:hypothetical protein